MFTKLMNNPVDRDPIQPEGCGHLDSSECTCDCHKSQMAVNHLIACCQFCPDCQRNIKTTAWISWRTMR